MVLFAALITMEMAGAAGSFERCGFGIGLRARFKIFFTAVSGASVCGGV